MILKKHIAGVLLFLLAFQFVNAQKYNTQSKVDKNGYRYKTVENDPLNARIYTLKNGLTVYLSEYKSEPRIQTYVAVRAGSKNDPSDATGLAHYLEHILFKGTSKIGTYDWETEKRYLDQIEQLYETYRATSDSLQRVQLYRQIDSISGIAATYAIANEYDKLTSSIGASGTNAYTFFEQTVYINDIPSNEIEKWAAIESERFSEVVARLFHTELEAVYEEKNIGLDNDRRKVWEAMLEETFKNHTYGTQTTIGTIEHLKSPSITKIKEYFAKHYVPNNMALCLSGDLNPENTIQIIDRYFSKLNFKPVTPFTPIKEEPITSPRVREVVGPDAENVSIAFRFPGIKNRESMLMELVSMILSNSQAGLIDLNLNQKQRLLGAYSYPLRLNDYSIHVLAGSPKEGQTLEQVRDLLLSQLALIKKGDFPDWLLQAIINDYKLSQMKSFESNKERADAFVTAFIAGLDWAEYVAEIDELEKVTKAEIVEFVNKHYKENYVLINKRTGTDKNVQKVPKPQITPVKVNRDKESDFFKEISSKPTPPLSPVFLDFEKDIVRKNVTKDIEILYKENAENDLFELYYIFDFGKNHNKKLGLAIQYLNYIGTPKYTAEQLNQEFYKLGCSFDVMSSDDQVYVVLKGLNENFIQGLELFEHILANAKPDKVAYKDMIDGILKARKDNKLNKRTILSSGLVSYAKYGAVSPFTDILTEKELRKIKPKELTKLIQSLYQYSHRVLYYGPTKVNDLEKTIVTKHKFKTPSLSVPDIELYKEIEIDKSIVYFTNYDMVQAEVILLSKSVRFDPGLWAVSTLYNEYFGGNMGSIVFQEIRESKALAYSVRSYYANAGKREKSNYIVSYIGTQADKLPEAMNAMYELLDSMPHSQSTFVNALTSLKSTLETERIVKSAILFSYEKARKLGIHHDMRKDVYEKIATASFDDVSWFYNKFIKDQPAAILVIGSKDNIDFEALKKYGEIKELSLEELFGY